MFEFIAALFIVVVIVLICRYYLALRILTSLTLGLTVGAIISGLLLGASRSFEDFDSERLAERSMTYFMMSSLAAILLLVHLVATAHHERRRTKQASL